MEPETCFVKGTHSMAQECLPGGDHATRVAGEHEAEEAAEGSANRGGDSLEGGSDCAEGVSGVEAPRLRDGA